jgi:hypothetical protein
MALYHPRPAIETPIERVFRKIVRRQMTKAERRYFHLCAVPRVRVASVSYANCPAQFCTGVVVLGRDMNSRQIFDKPSRTWNLQCSVCLHKFAIAEIDMKSDMSLAKLRQLYPGAARS